MELVTVFASDTIDDIVFIKNLLDKSGITYLVKNEYTQNLFGGLKPFSGHDPIAGSIQIQIREDDYDRCLELIEENVSEENEQTPSGTTVEEQTNEISDESEPNAYDEKRILYLAQVLSLFSIFLIPYIINVFILYQLKTKRKKIAIILFIISTVMAIVGMSFIILK